MRKIIKEFNVYSFEELSQDAKQNAIEQYRNSKDWLDWEQENNESCEAIAAALNCTFRTETYDGISINVILETGERYGEYVDKILELTGTRALAYICNNFIDPNLKGKFYSTPGSYDASGNYQYKKRYSKVQYGIEDCPFTGYCMDCNLFEAYQEFLKRIKSGCKLTVGDFIEMVENRLSKDWTSNNEGQQTDEYITDAITSNEYEYLEDGSQYY